MEQFKSYTIGDEVGKKYNEKTNELFEDGLGDVNMYYTNLLNIYQIYHKKEYNNKINMIKDNTISNMFLKEIKAHAELRATNEKYIKVFDFDNMEELEDKINDLYILIIDGEYKKISLSLLSLIINMNLENTKWFNNDWNIIKINEI
jgi:hypothetical protein